MAGRERGKVYVLKYLNGLRGDQAEGKELIK